MSREDVYLWPVGWERFQHYRDRDPTWLKLYTRLLSDDAWLGLTPPQQSLLVNIWLAFARAGGRLPIGVAETEDNPVDNPGEQYVVGPPMGAERTPNARRTVVERTAKLSRMIGQRVYKGSLTSLYRAGWVEFLYSATLDERLQSASVALGQSKSKSKIPLTPTTSIDVGDGGKVPRGHELERLSPSVKAAAKRAALVSFVRSYGAEYPTAADMVHELEDRGASSDEATAIMAEAGYQGEALQAGAPLEDRP